MPKQYNAALPNDEYSFKEFETLLDSIKHVVAGLIIEPLVQGAGGMKFHSPDVLAEIHRMCRERDILFIADEVATGLGRTGSMFACDEANISPDIMCIGKALTGGTTSLAATMANDRIFEGFLSDELTHAFMHGPTFMANPLACAAANASLDLIEQDPHFEKVARIESQMLKELAPCEKFSNVIDVRVKGALGVIQLADYSWDYMFSLRKKFIARGVFIRPFGNIVYLAPSYTIAPDELTTLTSAIVAELQA
jgi:adenosylmethionine-8-amino-7-oxononanoate aminotransferase